MPSWMKIKRAAFVLAGVLYMWIILGGLLGYVLLYVDTSSRKEISYVVDDEQLQFDADNSKIEKQTEIEQCYPKPAMLGISVRCDSAWKTTGWLLVMIPSFVIGVFHYAFGMLIARSPEAISFLIPCLLISIAVLYPGFQFWKKRYPQLAWVSLAFFLMICICA